MELLLLRSTASRRAKAKIARAQAKAKLVKANRREMAKERVRAKIPGGSLGSERMVRAMAAKRTTKEARRERIAAKACRSRIRCARDCWRNVRQVVNSPESTDRVKALLWSIRSRQSRE